MAKLANPNDKRKAGVRKSPPKPTRESAVGIFWWWQGRLLADVTSLSQAEEFESIVNGPQDHVQVWPQFQAQFPELQATGYIEIPRGRVLYRRRTKKFTVYFDRSLAKPKIKTAILAQFHLPPKQTGFCFDPHYTVNAAVIAAMFKSDI